MLSPDQLKDIKFTNLVQHTHWTIPLGIGTVKKQIQGTIKKGLTGFAITDHNVMSGVLEVNALGKDKDFIAQAHGLPKDTPKGDIPKLDTLMGVRLNFTDDLETKDPARLFQLTLFAKNKEGYKNLVYMTSISSDEEHGLMNAGVLTNRLGLYELMEYGQGVMIGSGGVNGILGQAIARGTGQEEELAQIFKDSFGDNFYIEIHYRPQIKSWDATTRQYNVMSEDVQRRVNLRLIELARQFDIKCCIVQGSYMIEEYHYPLQSILIQNHSDYKKGGWTMDQAYYVQSVPEMYEYIKKESPYITDEMFLEFTANTQYVLKECKNVILEFSPALPAIKYDEHPTNNDEYEGKLAELRTAMIKMSPVMVHLIDKSVDDVSLRTTIKSIIRLGKMFWDKQNYVDLLAFELKVMQRNGIIRLCDYFLLLEDVTNFVRDNGFLRGFGRGSGGGSLLTYVMDISDVDPIKYGLLFERFLTKERIGTMFFDVPNYPNKLGGAVEDLSNPYFDKVKALINKKRASDVSPEYLEKELFYLECNPNIAQYVFETASDLLGKKEKIENLNNSTLNYVLGVTDVVPKQLIDHTPTTLPDFDYDTDGRDEVKQYLVGKYGKSHVTLLGTVGTLKTKGAIKDILRQLRPQMGFEEVNELTKKFNLLKPLDFKTEIEFYQASLEADSSLKAWFAKNEDIHDALTMLLGNAKSTGVHAGGIVVSSRNVIEIIPMTWDWDGKIWVTQPEMAYVEKAGLVKYDFLGLKTLGDLNRVLRLVNSRHGKNYTLSNVPMDDKEVLDLFVAGETESVFQFNTNLATAILKQLKEIRSINDLAMITSIARPGPLNMGMDKVFISRNTETEPVEYLHPTLKPILNETYGILCIAEGSMVLTKKGQKKIEEVKPGELVMTENGSYQKVLANWNKGRQKTIRIRTTNGEELVCTADHKVLTNNGWKEAGKLTKLDLIKSFWTTPRAKQNIGNDQDWLIGLSLADGDLCGSQVNISCESEKFALKVKEIAEQSFGLGNVRVGFRERCWKTYLGHNKVGGGKGSVFADRLNPFMATIKKLGLFGKDCYTKRLPKNPSLSMLAGFIEGDGSLINFRVRLKNNALAYDLYEALQSYRIPSTYFIDKDGTANVGFNDFERKLPFRIKEFQQGSERHDVFIPRSFLPKLSKKEYGHLAQHTYPSKAGKPLKITTLESLGIKLDKDQHNHWSKVLSIKEDIVRQVYDLSIENVHSFVVGGLVVHNCYQEQIILIAKAVGNLDNDGSVTLMKALSKKQLDKVVKFKEKFVKNAVEKQYYQPKSAEELWNLLQAFAEYGFNKSHAIAYSAVSYLCMWFKYHYPAEWHSAVLTGAEKDDFKIIYPRWKDGIDRPDINVSKDTFVINDANNVVMPLNAINGVGVKAVENIVKNQPYVDFADFYNKIDKRQVNKSTTINLIFAGCFDSMKTDPEMTMNKWRKLQILEFLKLKHSAKKPSKAEKEADHAYLKEISVMNRGAMLMKEISLLNFTAFDYFEYYKDKMTDGARKRFGYEAITPGQVAEFPNKSTVIIGGAVESIDISRVKNPKSKIFGQEMCRIKISNAGESVEVVLFPKDLEKDDQAGGTIRNLQEYTPIVIKGQVSHFNGQISVGYQEGWILL